MKPIVLTVHARLQALERKASLNEIEETIRTAIWQPAEKGRTTCTETFVFRAEHYGRHCESKDIVPIFVEEETAIVAITVYTFFSRKEVK